MCTRGTWRTELPNDKACLLWKERFILRWFMDKRRFGVVALERNPRSDAKFYLEVSFPVREHVPCKVQGFFASHQSKQESTLEFRLFPSEISKEERILKKKHLTSTHWNPYLSHREPPSTAHFPLYQYRAQCLFQRAFQAHFVV